MTFIQIVIATLGAGIGSVWLAAALARSGVFAGSDDRATYVGPHHLLSLAAGALLATAFMQLLPEAFESDARAQALFTALLVGLVFFFLLDKAELWHHGHEHHQQGAHPGEGHDHDHDHGHHHHSPPKTGGWAVLTGDSLHCFGDGVMIASAFVAHPRLGWAAALADLIPQLQRRLSSRETVVQVAWLLVGIALVTAASQLSH